MARPPTDARTNERREREGEGGGRTDARASTYVYKKRKKKRIRYPDRSCRTLDAGPISGQGGPNFQDLGIGENEMGEGEIGERAANGKKRNHVARGREAAREFFFPYKKGPRAVQR